MLNIGKKEMDYSKFQRVLMGYLVWIFAPIAALFMLMIINSIAGYDILSALSNLRIAGIPLVSTNETVRFGGFAGVGIISVGGLAVGGIALGGGAIGLIAAGGAAVGVVAIGGGSLGLIAIGGGAVGYIAIGGGASGVYVLAGGGKGRHVLDYATQDEEAVSFFCRYLPRLRSAFVEHS